MGLKRFPRLIVFSLLVLLALAGSWLLGSTVYGVQMDHYATDWFFRLRGDDHAGIDRIAIVAIDDQTLKRFGNLPLDRSLVAEALARICRARPRAVAVDILFPELSNPEADRFLANVLAACPQTVLATNLRDPEGSGQPEAAVWMDPVDAFEQAAGAVAHVHADPDVDGVSRQILLMKSAGGPAATGRPEPAQRRWALALEALRIYAGHRGPVLEDDRSLVVADHIIPATRDTERALLINYAGGEGTVPRHSFAELLSGQVPGAALAGRTVLIGVTAAGAGDRIFTPFSSAGRGMPGVEVHANVLRTMLTGRYLYPLRASSALLAMSAVALAVALALSALAGVWLAVALAVLGAAWHVAPYFLFARWNLLAPYFSFSLAFWAPLLVGGVFQYRTVWRGYQDARAASQRFREGLEFVAHEIRSPLTAIQGSGEVISRYPLNEERRKQLGELVSRESQRLGAIIQRFLDVERLEAGELQLQRVPVPLSEVVRRAIDRAQVVAIHKDILLSFEPAGEVHSLGDAELLEFALYNLLGNAIKYSPEGSNVDVALRSNAALGMAFVDVTDRGEGIPLDEQSKIFERFYRAGRARGSGESGLGLGLSIVREIARHHNGSVLLESGPGRGSKFSLALPLHAAADAPGAMARGTA